MRIDSQQITCKRNQNHPKFGGFTDLMMENIFLNKTLFDLTGSDIPWVVMANNKEERRERLNRAILSTVLVFVSPVLILPFANRIAMNKIVKLTPELFSKNFNAVRLSNKYLSSAEKTKEGLEKLSKQKTFSNELKDMYYKYIKRKPVPEEKLDIDALLQNVKGDTLDEKYDVLRKKISTAKNIVLGTDLFLIAAPFGHIGFFNNWQTEKKTGQIGYSAEMKMADKEVIEKRAVKFKRNEKIRYGVFLASLAGLVVGLPIAVRHGVISQKGFMKKLGEKFDYKDAIFASRLPMFLSFIGAHIGIFMASRNNTERKDNAIRSSTAISIFFLGDLLLSSILGRASDSTLGTKTLKRKENGSWFNKLLPPMKNLQELKATNCPKTVRNAKIIFWTNFIFLSAMMGIITPHLINKIIKKDVDKDAKKQKGNEV